MTHLVGISGSLRSGSSNTLLVDEAARLFAPDLYTRADLQLPLLNTDLETPAEVGRLVTLIGQADAIVISTPEYNRMISGLLKNALDWVSLASDGNPLADKPVAIISSAAGRSGGERSQYTLRHALLPHFARVLTGPEVAIAGAGEAFDDKGRLKDEKSTELLGKLMESLKAEVALHRG
ncbi:NADPH-dependent FMN reductase [Pontivivens nitratireducens]|uniref:NAD(P)H-dependent oxidoreductase n=1 Tax=Pontivivens nitratireducens TaxID=2758038 RepID=A0A6G7VJK8_9RHOB|nr:NAD(P)H-dependent oxidoreductase [Pontibrevibacter nitratireducens]QIK40080.1 NAD(P)H-dependent oxidoreductase [Pontibrevibacter nitratireducens]